MLLGEKAENATIYDLQGLARFKKFGAIAIAIIMFSLIGIPPFAGFFAKYIILYEALKAKLYLLFAIGLLSALIASYYYLKIIAMLYFSKSNIMGRVQICGNSMIVAIISILFVIFFSVLPIKHILDYKIYLF
jgi:NADH-quinone oxidoreductase subunit N